MVARIRERFWPLFGLLFLTILLLIEQFKLVFGYLSSHTNIDQTLLWYAGTEFVSGRLHQPNFYGQKYNTIYEAVPGALLHKIGITFGLAIVLGTTALATIIWILLSLLAYKKQKYGLALLALAAPMIMRIQYLALLDSPRGILAGDLMAVFSICCAFWLCKDSAQRIACLITIGGLAILWDYAAALIVAPAFL